MEAIVSEIGIALSGAKSIPQEGPGVVELKKNVCYIVTATIFDEDGRVLMMREAKASCRGKWYLPAGRMEPGETIEAAVVRETLEETGLLTEPTALLCVEAYDMTWFRFTFTGNVIGGKLKTEKEQDKESIEAGWFSPEDVMTGKLCLRVNDICRLIKHAMKWNTTHKSNPICRCLPGKAAHSRISISLVLLRAHEGNDNEFLGFKPPGQAKPCLPVWTAESPFESLVTVINRLVRKAGQIEHEVHGILQLEHSTTPEQPTDGLHLTILAEVVTYSGELCENHVWVPLADIGKKLRKLISSEGFVKLIKLR